MPFVAAYLVVSYLQGGIGVGSSGLLANLRQYLWVPIFQTAYKCAVWPGCRLATPNGAGGPRAGKRAAAQGA